MEKRKNGLRLQRLNEKMKVTSAKDREIDMGLPESCGGGHDLASEREK